ncbi:glycine/D-amino acid oxidase-like deaminating enzyme [Bacillus ectoiniformans]|uniref:NAD(P)/FAD-dependent oxidoreductase n=1 Tax=Bacillus ectoiniformans TaxID=1494429 RepID=UPI00195E2596|nr:FAD-dependent oxidoreductase [Bacillus ectoiniformans]MBM7649867.1 glycine/D-amino acid oxidase-like deaminating enzyme [Bacillus ectoiniformans]
MNLQTGEYYWPTTFSSPPSYPSLNSDEDCDVLIIGGGGSGAQCAYYLADKGLNVIVVEKEKVGCGTTSTNTALIQYMGEKLFINLVHTFGEEYISRHLQLCKQAIDEIEQASQSGGIDADFKRRDTLYFASCPEDVQKLEEEYLFLKAHQFPLDFLSEEEIGKKYPFKKPAAIYSYNDAELNPFKFAHTLFACAAEKGVKIFEQTEVNGKKFENGGATIRTKTGHTIKAKKVIIAAGYEGMEFKKEKKASFVSTYSVVTNPVSDLSAWHNQTLIWETARPYLFARTTADQRIIIGGLDEDTFYAEERDSKLMHKKEQLIHDFQKLFPSIQVQAEYYSAAFYGGTVDGLPIIGEYDEYPNTHFLFGFGDNGTVYSMILAKIIAELVVNGSSPDAELYYQHRPLLAKHSLT